MFRFTLRELVLVTLVVAMAAAWWVDRNELARERDGWNRAFIRELQSGGHVRFDLDDPATLTWLEDSEADLRSERLKASITDRQGD